MSQMRRTLVGSLADLLVVSSLLNKIEDGGSEVRVSEGVSLGVGLALRGKMRESRSRWTEETQAIADHCDFCLHKKNGRTATVHYHKSRRSATIVPP